MLNFCTFGIRLSRYCIQAVIRECSANSYFARAIVATRVTLHTCKPLTVPFCPPFNRIGILSTAIMRLRESTEKVSRGSAKRAPRDRRDSSSVATRPSVPAG
jgi:hypothetical protein